MNYPKPQEISKYFTIGYPLGKMNSMIITQKFGENSVEYYRKSLGMLGHNGLDMRAASGTPIYAVCDGTIEQAKTFGDGGIGVYLRSNTIQMNDEMYQLEFVYYHLASYIVEKGQMVSRGQLLGYTDNTGRYTTAPHLHFGCKLFRFFSGDWVKEDNNGYFGAIDPMPLFEGEEHETDAVSRKYDLPEDEWSERLYEMFQKDDYVKSMLGRKPTQDELVALSYGLWKPWEVADPAFDVLWRQDTRIDWRAEIEARKLRN